jgi:hypothetical protein
MATHNARHQQQSAHFWTFNPFVKFPLAHTNGAILSGHSSVHFSGFHTFWPQSRITDRSSFLVHSANRDTMLHMLRYYHYPKGNENQLGAIEGSFYIWHFSVQPSLLRWTKTAFSFSFIHHVSVIILSTCLVVWCRPTLEDDVTVVWSYVRSDVVTVVCIGSSSVCLKHSLVCSVWDAHSLYILRLQIRYVCREKENNKVYVHPSSPQPLSHLYVSEHTARLVLDYVECPQTVIWLDFMYWW